MALPELVKAFLAQRAFTFEEARARSPHPPRQTLRVTLSRLTRSGYLVHPRRGLYVVADPDRPGKVPPVDAVYVAQKAAPESVAAYQTALELHGVARSASDVVWLKVERPLREFSFGSVQVRMAQVRGEEMRQGTSKMARDLGPVTTTDKEQTVLDALRHPERCGGTSEAFHSLSGFEYLNWDHLLDLLEEEEQRTVYARLGFLLTWNQKKWRVPKSVMEHVREKAPSYPSYFGNEARGGFHDAEWNLVVPRDLLAARNESAGVAQ